MHKWLLYPVLTADPEKLSKGLKYREIRDCLECHHPERDKLNPGNLTQALKSVVSLQLAKQIQPIIIDYDDTNRILHIVDRGFIIWVEFSEKDYLLELAERCAESGRCGAGQGTERGYSQKAHCPDHERRAPELKTWPKTAKISTFPPAEDPSP